MIRIDSGQLDLTDGGAPEARPRTVTGAEEIVLPPAPPQPPAPPTARRRWPRRFFYLALAIFTLIVLLLIIVQLVLWTDYPRRYVVAQLENELGLRVQADALTTTWSGRTELKNVALSLPLGKDAFVRVPRLDVRHTSLVPLLLRRPLNIKSLTLSDPTLVVEQDRAGNWDIVEVAELLARVGGGQQAKSADASAAATRTILPQITIRNATLRLRAWKTEPVEIHNISLDGRPDGPLVYRYDATAGARAANEPYLALQGEVAPGGSWRHTIHAAAQNLKPWLAPLVPNWPEDAAAQFAWEGELNPAGLAGLLDIESLRALGLSATGSLNVSAAPGRATITPRTLILHTPNPLAPELSLTAGTLTATTDSLTADNLALHALGGALQLTADYTRATGAARAQLAWQNLRPANAATLNGTATVALSTTNTAAQNLALTFAATADTPAGMIDAAADLHATGAAWNNLAWDADIARAAWSGWPPLALAHAIAKGRLTPTRFTLASLTQKSPGTLDATGDYNFADNTWSATLRANDLPVLHSSDTADIALDAAGNPSTLTLQHATITAAGITAEARGAYRLNDPKPLDLALDLHETSLAQNPPPANTATALQGKVRGNAHLHGTVTPLNLDVTGKLLARNLTLRDRPLGNADIDLTGALTDHDLHLRAADVDLLGGRWTANAAYPFASRRATINLGVSNLPLAQLADALHWQAASPEGKPAPMLAGRASAALSLDAPSLDLAQSYGQGTLEITDPQLASITPGVPAINAQSASAKITINNGTIELSPDIRQAPTQNAEQPAGNLTGKLTVNLQDLDRLTAHLRLDHWTLASPKNNSQLRLSANLDGALDLPTLSGNATASTRTELFYQNKHLGDVAADAALAGRLITLSTLRADILGGTIDGVGRVNLDNLLASSFNLTFTNIDAAHLVPFNPWLEGARGSFSGALALGPDPDPHALEPLKLTALLVSHNASYRGIPIGNASATGFASTTRLVLDRSAIDIDSGKVTLWARTVQRDGRWTTSQLHVGVEAVDLDPIVHAFHPQSKLMIGKLTGQLDALGNPRRPNDLSGGGVVYIEKSDLANSDIIGALYSLMNIAALPNGDGPTGRGRMTFRFEQGDAQVTELYYFNRGVQIRGTGTVKDILNMPQSPLDLVLAGTARPLREVRLPVVTDIDEIIAVLQSNVTTIRANGTVANPAVTPVLLEQAGRDLIEILTGDARRR